MDGRLTFQETSYILYLTLILQIIFWFNSFYKNYLNVLAYKLSVNLNSGEKKF